MFYSKTTGGFYSEGIHGPRQLVIPDPDWVRPMTTVDGNLVPDADAVPATIAVDNPACKIPEDAVEVTDEDYRSLLAAQSQGKVIKADENGHPVAEEPEVSQNDAIKAQIVALEATVTQRRMREAIMGTDNGWLEDVEAQIAALRAQLQ